MAKLTAVEAARNRIGDPYTIRLIDAMSGASATMAGYARDHRDASAAYEERQAKVREQSLGPLIDRLRAPLARLGLVGGHVPVVERDRIIASVPEVEGAMLRLLIECEATFRSIRIEREASLDAVRHRAQAMRAHAATFERHATELSETVQAVVAKWRDE